MRDLEEDLISNATARDVFKVVYDEKSRLVDIEGTEALRAEERKARIARSKPFDAFVADWVTPEPPAEIPFMGCWDRQDEVYGVMLGNRVKMNGNALQSQFMLNPKDVRIAELEAEVAALKGARS